MNSNKKIEDDFRDIRREIIEGGLNIKHWAKHRGFSESTTTFALAGFPKTKRAAMIRQEARKAVALLKSPATAIIKE